MDYQDYPTIRELRGMTDDELIERHDSRAGSGSWTMSEYFLDELARRESASQTQRMVNATQTIMWLTVAITFLTLVNVWAVSVAAD